MIDFKFTVHPDGGEPFEVTAGPRDQLVWEQATPGRSVGKLMVGGIQLTELYPLAHAAAKRAGSFTGSLAEFQKNVDLEMGHTLTEDDEAAETEDVGPTPPTR